jgi:hypothetical protein
VGRGGEGTVFILFPRNLSLVSSDILQTLLHTAWNPSFFQLHFPHIFYIENDGLHPKDPNLVVSSFIRDNSSAFYKAYC